MCGTVWIGTEGLRLGPRLVDWVFVIMLKGSRIDVQYAQERRERKERTCPNCNNTTYYQEEIK
jgi:hypothetical protein